MAIYQMVGPARPNPQQLGVNLSLSQLLIFLLPLILMCGAYYKVIMVLWRSTKVT